MQVRKWGQERRSKHPPKHVLYTSLLSAGRLLNANGMRETTVAETIISIFKMAVRHNWTYSAITSALTFIAESIAPPGSEFPSSHKAALRLIAPYATACHRLTACSCDGSLLPSNSDSQQLCKACGSTYQIQTQGRAFYFASLQSLVQHVFADAQKAALIRACSGPICRG